MFLYALGFWDEVLPSLQVYLRTLHPKTSFKLLEVNHVLGSMQMEEFFTKSRSIRDWRKNSIIG